MSAAAIYPRLFAKLFRSPLMLHQPVRSTFEQALLQRMFGAAESHEGRADALLRSGSEIPRIEASTSQQRPRSTLGQPHDGTHTKDFEEVQNWMKARDEYQSRRRVERIYRKIGKVAVVTIAGVIDKRVSDFDLDCYGGVDLADVDAALADAAADPAIEIIVLDLNTPGGSVTGTVETAARVMALREHKEIHAFVDVLCCSAGYFIASQADRITAAPSAILGSIGVYMAVLDATRAIEMDGFRVQMMKSGRHKAMGAPWNPLTDEERGMLQKQCDDIYAQFTDACTALRPLIHTETMQGQWFDGAEAEDRHLVDDLSGESLDEFVTRLLLRN